MRVFLPFLLALFLLSGCNVLGQYYDPYGTRYPRHDRTVYGDARHGHETQRIRRDARNYVRQLDRRLHLSSRQARNIERLLVDRTDRHLRRNSRSYGRDYPFPRSRNRARGFWRSADRAIERRLDRYQRAEFRYMTGRTNRRQYQYRNGRWYDNVRYHRNRDRDGDRSRARARERQRERAKDRRERARDRAEKRRERASEQRERDGERARERRERDRDRRNATVNRVQRVLGVD